MLQLVILQEFIAGDYNMCGIAGIFYSDINRPVEPNLIEKMCNVIHHRGPDEWGMWCKDHVGFGMKRLSIIDLSSGKQPIASPEGNIRIVFNGEIYNYRELRLQLENKGYRFLTNTDTETILYQYEEYGIDCVQNLRGMFAFAIWDARTRKLFIARDRFGKKPLHYYLDGDKFVFGSEIKSLLQHPEILKEVNHQAIINYIAYGYTPEPDTMFKGIAKLPPGHTLIWQEGNIKISSYWDLEFKPDNTSKEDKYYIEKVENLLKESVKIRMISDVPLGAFLSGGIDSSLVVAMMAQQSNNPIKTFSIGFDNQKYNELPYARLVAQRYGTEHHEEIVKPDAETVITDIINVFDEPFADSSAIPTYYVSRLAKKYVTVALSGDGGDELFAGYDRYIDSLFTICTDKISYKFRKWTFGLLASILPESFYGTSTLRYIAADPDSRYISKMTAGISQRYNKVFSKELLSNVKITNPAIFLQKLLDRMKGKDVITKRQYADIKSYLVGDILTKVDRTSMLVSLETRAPLLDHKLAEFAATLPISMKVRRMVLKNILKMIALKYLPSELINRPKMGFAIPIGLWINQEWRDMSWDLILGERSLQRQNFKPDYIQRIMTEHRNGRRDHSGSIWKLMVLEMWYRKFFD